MTFKPPPPIKVSLRALPMIVSSYELPRTVESPSGSESVTVSTPGITVWGPVWPRLIETPAGAAEKSSPAMLVPAASTTVSLPIELLLNANVSLPPPPTSESSPVPATSVSELSEPIKVSSPVPPWRMVVPEKPEASSVKSPVPAARIACWKPLIVETDVGRAAARERQGAVGERHVGGAVVHQPRIEPARREHVVAAAAGDRAVAGAAVDRVLTGPAVDEVVARAAHDRVVAGVADRSCRCRCRRR